MRRTSRSRSSCRIQLANSVEIGISHQFAGGIADAEALSRGRLVAIALKPVGTLAMLGVLLRGALGRLGEADQVVSFPLRSLAIRPPGRGRTRPRRYKVAMDGEVTRLAAPLLFRVAPEPLLLMVPPATPAETAG